jgi:predicted amidohydrolase YtcJ
MQPHSDMQGTKELLGETRSAWQYPVKTFLDKGVKVSFGTDWPVSEINPLHSIQVAITHQQIGTNELPWLPSERITLQDALQCYTIGSAFVNFMDDETGTIEVGKKADVIILNKNLFSIPPETIHTAAVTLTIINGNIVYRAAP